MNAAQYLQHLHTPDRPGGYPVRKIGNRFIPVGLGQLEPIDLTTLPQQRQEKPPLQITVREGQKPFPWAIIIVILLGLALAKG